MATQRKLNDDNDIFFENGVAARISGDNERAQFITQKLQTLLTEWFINTALGVNYFGLLGKNFDITLIDSAIKAQIIGTDGIVSLVSYESELSEDRAIDVNFVARLLDGATITDTFTATI